MWLHSRNFANSTLLFYCGVRWANSNAKYWTHSLHLNNSVVSNALRWYFVRFEETPNEMCYKFYIDNVLFLPKDCQTLLFDRTNYYQSPLAQLLLQSLPMIHEVTLSSSFITVCKVKGNTMARKAAESFAQELNEQNAESELERSIEQDDNYVKQKEFTANMESKEIMCEKQKEVKENVITHEKTSVITEDIIDENALVDIIEHMEWDELRLHVSAIITDHLYSNAPHINLDAPPPHSDTEPCSTDSETVLIIKEFIATIIRPELQRDGGDVKFIEYNETDGVLLVELLGACRRCNNSTSTLFDLIERSIRHWIPEVKEVNENVATEQCDNKDQIEKKLALISSVVDNKLQFDKNIATNDKNNRINTNKNMNRKTAQLIREVRKHEI